MQALLFNKSLSRLIKGWEDEQTMGEPGDLPGFATHNHLRGKAGGFHFDFLV